MLLRCCLIHKSIILRPQKKVLLVSGNRPGEKFFITHLPAESNVYQNQYFCFFKKKTRRQKAKETKEEKRICLENLTGYDDIVCEVALCIFNLCTHFQEQKFKKIIKIHFCLSFSRLCLFICSYKFVMIEILDYDKAHKDDENAMSFKVYFRVKPKAAITGML